jgi:hypothetical protein
MSRPYQSSIVNNITSPENRQSPLEDDVQQRQAERLAQHVFPEPDATGKAVEVIWSFIRSYDRHRHEMPLEPWLIQELARYPHLWQDNAEAEQVARMLIASLTRTNLHKESLQQHLDKGKSAANWLASELEQDARGNPELNLGEYAGQVRDMLLTGNQTLARGLAPDTPHTTVPTDIAVPAGVATVWDENSRLEIAREIDNQALLNAALNAAGQGARILGRRAWNWLRDVENAPASEALQEFFNSSLKSAKHVGAQVAVSGGVVVATGAAGWGSLGTPRSRNWRPPPIPGWSVPRRYTSLVRAISSPTPRSTPSSRPPWSLPARWHRLLPRKVPNSVPNGAPSWGAFSGR